MFERVFPRGIDAMFERSPPSPVYILAVTVPRTKRFDPVGGFTRVPMDTPFGYATFPKLLVHCDEVILTFAAAMTRPY